MRSGLVLLIMLIMLIFGILLPLPLIVILNSSTTSLLNHRQVPSLEKQVPYQLPKPDPDGWITLYRGNSSEIEPIEPLPNQDFLIPLAPAYTDKLVQQI